MRESYAVGCGRQLGEGGLNAKVSFVVGTRRRVRFWKTRGVGKNLYAVTSPYSLF